MRGIFGSPGLQVTGYSVTVLSQCLFHLIVAGMEGTLVGSDTKAPSGITLISLPL